MKRLAVVGAGRMAHIRTQAFLETQRVMLCGVAARRLSSAQAFAYQYGCDTCFDEFRRLSSCAPDVVLVETPHLVQEDVVRWALETGAHVLIGGSPANSAGEARRIAERAAAQGSIVEAGYEARYKAVWESARRRLHSGEIGTLIAVRAVALFAADPASWYYDQTNSGGMPLTHMTYAFLNPLRGLLGHPLHVSAFANRKKHTGPGLVREETCVAGLLFPDEVLCTLTAGYVRSGPADEDAAWQVIFLGTGGELHVFPSDEGPGSLQVHSGGKVTQEVFTGDKPFLAQAQCFLDAIDGTGSCRNAPAEFVADVMIAEAVAASAASHRTIAIGLP
ncbi:Gfo/Idh/MocA family oxidoreductase [Roseibium sp.]|uniref:Gfo/Idh/MocA family protein n=1 Tax=Roseibium sp. TaxID=1936156 RepID=UPI00326414E6